MVGMETIRGWRRIECDDIYCINLKDKRDLEGNHHWLASSSRGTRSSLNGLLVSQLKEQRKTTPQQQTPLQSQPPPPRLNRAIRPLHPLPPHIPRTNLAARLLPTESLAVKLQQTLPTPKHTLDPAIAQKPNEAPVRLIVSISLITRRLVLSAPVKRQHIVRRLVRTFVEANDAAEEAANVKRPPEHVAVQSQDQTRVHLVPVMDVESVPAVQETEGSPGAGESGNVNDAGWVEVAASSSGLLAKGRLGRGRRRLARA